MVGAPVSLAQVARWSMVPTEARIGQPTRWSLALEHDSADRVLSPPKEFSSGTTQILVTEGPRVATVPDSRGRARTTMTWTVLGVEPGEAKGPVIDVSLESGIEIEWVEAPGLRVLGELAPDEDRPRPLPAGLGMEGLVPRSVVWPWVVLGITVLGGAWFGFSRLRKARGTLTTSASEVMEAPAERLARLLHEEAEGNPKAVGYGVSGALRDAVESHTGRQEPGHAMGEWLADQASTGALTNELRGDLVKLLERAENLKFGPAEGRLGQRELVQSAQAWLESLAKVKGSGS